MSEKPGAVQKRRLATAGHGRVRWGGVHWPDSGTNEPSPGIEKLVAFLRNLPRQPRGYQGAGRAVPASAAGRWSSTTASTARAAVALFALRDAVRAGASAVMASTAGPTSSSPERCRGRSAPEANRRAHPVAHLGSGASLCALRDGKSVEGTLWLQRLDGLPMGRGRVPSTPASPSLAAGPRHGRPRQPKGSATRSWACWGCPGSATTCATCWRATIPGEGSDRAVRLPHHENLGALTAVLGGISTPECLPPASVSTHPKFGNMSAAAPSGSDFASIPLRTPRMALASRPQKAPSRHG